MTSATDTTTTTMTTTDSIQKQIVLRATPARVWRALSNAHEFGTWFGVELHDDFVPGATVHGKKVYQGKDITFTFHIERMESERSMSFRWHPYSVDPSINYSREPTTLVEFTLAPSAGGTLLTVTESGFDQIPLARRAKAFEMNNHGWGVQMQNIARHVDA